MTSSKAYRQNWPKNSREAWTNWKAPHLSDFAVTPGFAYNIARYFPSSQRRTTDKDLCVKLMKDLGLSSDPVSWYSTVSKTKKNKYYKARPPSAPPRLQEMESFSQNPDQFYMTSHKKEFDGLYGPPAGNARPSSAKLFPYRPNDEETTYKTEFSEKRIRKCEVARTGTASGVRRNNPHPSEAFMIWKFPSHLPPLDPGEYSTANMQEITYDQLKSTYQNDYTGIPQGVQIKTAFDGQVRENLPKPPYTLDSTSRRSYQKPEEHESLKCDLSRYGCNKNKYKATVGAVPTVYSTSPQLHLSGRTEYNDEYYRKRLSNITGDQVRYKSGPIPALEEFLKNANPQEKDALVKELKQIAKDGDRDTRDRQWFSEWTGPS